MREPRPESTVERRRFGELSLRLPVAHRVAEYLLALDPEESDTEFDWPCVVEELWVGSGARVASELVWNDAIELFRETCSVLQQSQGRSTIWVAQGALRHRRERSCTHVLVFRPTPSSGLLIRIDARGFESISAAEAFGIELAGSYVPARDDGRELLASNHVFLEYGALPRAVVPTKWWINATVVAPSHEILRVGSGVRSPTVKPLECLDFEEAGAGIVAVREGPRLVASKPGREVVQYIRQGSKRRILCGWSSTDNTIALANELDVSHVERAVACWDTTADSVRLSVGATD